MAKKKSANKVNKSELIRTYIAENPDKSPKEVAEVISAQIGSPISAQFVSTTKSNAKKAAGKKPGKRGPKPKSESGGTIINGGFAPKDNGFALAFPVFKAASELLKVAGDRATAREVLDMVAALRS